MLPHAKNTVATLVYQKLINYADNLAQKVKGVDEVFHCLTLYLPQCAIINKKGELQFMKAASPEDIDKLTKQLQEASE